jgi:2-dehydropantoate 2-reductase
MSVKVAIIGSGAIGCLFAARLARAGVDTTLVDYKADRAKRLRKSGIRVETAEGPIEAEVDCVTSVPKGVKLQIVAVKSYSTESVRLTENVPTLSLQNGLGNIDLLCAKVGSASILAGITSEGAHLLEEGVVRHGGSGTTMIGSWTSCPVDGAIEALSSAGFETEVTESPGQAIWEKVAINAGINPITALLNISNGQLLAVAEVRQLLRDLVVEAVKVSATEGYRFEHSLVEVAEEVCQTTAENISSMLQDVRAGKRTEIEAISGEIGRRAQTAGLPVPRTRAIYQLIRGLEQR